MPKKIVIAEFMDQATVEGLRDMFDILYDPDLVDRPDDLLSELATAQGLIVRNRTQVRGALLAAAGQLKVVARLGVGLDNIDTERCKARGIEVCPATGANDLSVAEYVLTCALALLRGAYQGFDRMIAGEWPRHEMSGQEGAGKLLGLVGFGSIARETAKRGRALGFEVIASDPFVPETDPAWQDVRRAGGLEELLGVADIVSLHVPLTPDTRNLLDAAMMARMKTGGILINAARGGVVDEPALAAHMRSGQIGGAALDVFASEPLTAQDGRIFAGLTNLILTPHIAGVTQQSNIRVSAATADNMRRALGGA